MIRVILDPAGCPGLDGIAGGPVIRGVSRGVLGVGAQRQPWSLDGEKGKRKKTQKFATAFDSSRL